MKFEYEIVEVGGTPTWEKTNNETFHNPVHVGEKVKPAVVGAELLTVVSVEHYTFGSVLYVSAGGQ